MGNNPRLIMGLGVVAVAGLLVTAMTGAKLIGIIVVLAAIAGIVFLIRSGRTTADDFFEPPAERPAPAARRAPEPEPLVEDEAEYDEPVAAVASDGGLPTWDGGEPLAAWSPPADEDTDDTSDAVSELEDLDDLDFGDDEDEWATLDDEFQEIVEDEADEADEEEALEAEPLPEFEFEEEELEPEPEPAKGGGGFSFGNNSKIQQIEDVHTADDIMASSAATELEISSDKGENSELARLLAKVQSRLAAYD